MVDGFWFGAWPNPPAGASDAAPFIQGPNGLWYTQTWCNGWGLRGVCVAAAGSNLLPAASWDSSTQSATTTSTATVPYVTGMKICYGKKQVRGITFTYSNFQSSWTFVSGNPPQQNVNEVSGSEATVSCGLTDDCLWSQNFNAPDGKVLGAVEGKCKFTQGWFKYVQNGQYKSKYFLNKVEKVCVLDPTPFPIGAFVPCNDPNCILSANNPLGPNNPLCSDVDTYACPSCKK
jgi:hypothetical protein